MQIIELLYKEDIFEEYLVELTDEERSNPVDARTFWALGVAERIRGRYGILAAVFSAIVLAIWSDFK